MAIGPLKLPPARRACGLRVVVRTPQPGKHRGGRRYPPGEGDPASGIGIPVAFGAGLISFLSPCVLPLVPGYISAVAGVEPSEIKPRRVIGPSLAFVASFSTIFIILGLLGQQALHSTLTGPTALKISGAVIIAMGVLFILAPLVPRLAGEIHV